MLTLLILRVQQSLVKPHKASTLAETAWMLQQIGFYLDCFLVSGHLVIPRDHKGHKFPFMFR